MPMTPPVSSHSVSAPPTSTSGGAPDDVTAYTYDAAGELLTTTTGSGTARGLDDELLLRPRRGQDRQRGARRQHLRGRQLLGLVALRDLARPTRPPTPTTASGELVTKTAPPTTAVDQRPG